MNFPIAGERARALLLAARLPEAVLELRRLTERGIPLQSELTLANVLAGTPMTAPPDEGQDAMEDLALALDAARTGRDAVAARHLRRALTRRLQEQLVVTPMQLTAALALLPAQRRPAGERFLGSWRAALSKADVAAAGRALETFAEELERAPAP